MDRAQRPALRVAIAPQLPQMTFGEPSRDLQLPCRCDTGDEAGSSAAGPK